MLLLFAWEDTILAVSSIRSGIVGAPCEMVRSGNNLCAGTFTDYSANFLAIFSGTPSFTSDSSDAALP
jgi:hypothetical protein